MNGIFLTSMHSSMLRTACLDVDPLPRKQTPLKRKIPQDLPKGPDPPPPKRATTSRRQTSPPGHVRGDACWEEADPYPHPPWADKMCKNITFPQLLFASGYNLAGNPILSNLEL